MSWDAILAMHDRAILTLFAGVVAFAVNWYVFRDKRHLIIGVPFVGVAIILVLEFIERFK